MMFSPYRRNAKRRGGNERKALKRKKLQQEKKQQKLKKQARQKELINTCNQKITDVTILVNKFAAFMYDAFSLKGGELILRILVYAHDACKNKVLNAANRKAVLEENLPLYTYTNLCYLDKFMRENPNMEAIRTMTTLLQACFLSYDDWMDAVIEGARNGIPSDTFNYITNNKDFDEKFYTTNLLQKIAARITGEEIHIFMPDSWSEPLVGGQDWTMIDFVVPLGRAMGLEVPQIRHLLRFSDGSVERYLAT